MQDNPQFAYGWEKLFTAVLTLTGSEKSLRNRLSSCYVYSLLHIREQNLPKELWEKFEKITEVCTKADKWNEEEGRVKASIDMLEELELNKLAEEIVSLYGAICSVHKIHKLYM